ncbi:MAG: TSUP family transporter [Paracoccaceae bacterium]
MAAAFLAGFVDAIAGGGGLITLPVLLLAGATPLEALATNKLQGTFGAGAAAASYARAGQVDLLRQAGMAGIAGFAGGLGAVIAHLVPLEVLRVIMPVVLIAVAVFFAMKPGLTDADRLERLSPGVFAVTLVPLVAAYDGVFGPGAGAFYMLGFVMLAGFGVLKAVAHTKLLNFASNLGALAVFAASGGVWWGMGLAMAAAQVAGASLGATVAMRRGARLIKPLLVVTSTLLALRLIWQALGA